MTVACRAQAVYDFVDTLEEVGCLRYSLASSFPRIVFSGADKLPQSLEQLGLAPQALLLLQPEDD